MAEDKSVETEQGEETEGEATEEQEAGKAKAAEQGTPRVGLHGLLTRDSDMAARPGFRNPANARTKAQKAGKKGKKKR